MRTSSGASDLRIGERGRRRDPQLLEEVFRLACRYAGQAPPIHTLADEVRAVYRAKLGDQRVRQDLRFLSDSLLIRAIEPREIRLKKKRGSQKLGLVDHALRASWLQEFVPLVPTQLAGQPALSTLAGRLAESVVGAVLPTIVGLDLAHLPARLGDPEVDFVLTIGTQRIPIEVKYQATLDARDAAGLRSFLDAKLNNASFGLLVTQKIEQQDFGPGVVALPLASLMLMR